MNNRLIQIFAIVVACLAGMLAIIAALTGGGNEIGQFAMYCSVACFFLGVIAPRPAMVVLLVLAGYSDLLKRFMILGSSITQFDLVYVLAMAPMVLAGVTLTVFLKEILRGRPRKEDLMRFGLCFIVLASVSASAYLGGGGVKSLRVVADYGAFLYLIYVLPILFPDRDSLLTYAKTALVIFIPVAMYGIWQRVYGLADFELDYLATGLSIETRQLGQIGFRPFSTLNAATSLTIVTAACAMLSCVLVKFRRIPLVIGAALAILFGVGCIMTFTRGGWVSLAAFPVIAIVFRHKFLTVLGYMLSVVAVILVIYFSDWFIGNLHNWQNQISGDVGTSTQAMKVTTLYDRFLGFSNLKNPDNWQPFGVEQQTYSHEYRYDNPAFSHDMLSRFIFKWGYVPTFALLVAVGSFLVSAHKRILAQPMDERKFTTLIFGANAALLVSTAAGGYVFQFPANIFLWIITCLSISSLKVSSANEGEEEEVNLALEGQKND